MQIDAKHAVILKEIQDAMTEIARKHSAFIIQELDEKHLNPRCALIVDDVFIMITASPTSNIPNLMQ